VAFGFLTVRSMGLDECIKASKAADAMIVCNTDGGALSTLASLASIAASLAIIATAVFAYRQVNAIMESNRLSKTLDLLVGIQTNTHWREDRKKFIDLRDSQSGLKPYAKQASEDCLAIKGILNRYELIAIGIQHGILDENMYKKYQKGTLIKDYRQSAAFIEEERIENPKYWVEMQRLAEKFEKGRS
jgi:hypothetical protein